MIKATTSGIRSLRQRLAPPSLQDHLLEALALTADSAHQIFRNETPKSSGATAEAWEIVPISKKVVDIVNAHRERGYLIMAGIEFGTPAHVIRPRHGQALAFKADRSSRAEGRVLSGQARQLNPVRAQSAMGAGGMRRLHMPRGQGIKSPIRYGNYIKTPNGQLRKIVASDIASGTPQFRTARGGMMAGGHRAERLVVVSLVRHPGTRPNPVVRRNIPLIRELLRQHVRDAVRAALQL